MSYQYHKYRVNNTISIDICDKFQYRICTFYKNKMDERWHITTNGLTDYTELRDAIDSHPVDKLEQILMTE